MRPLPQLLQRPQRAVGLVAAAVVALRAPLVVAEAAAAVMVVDEVARQQVALLAVVLRPRVEDVAVVLVAAGLLRLPAPASLPKAFSFSFRVVLAPWRWK